MMKMLTHAGRLVLMTFLFIGAASAQTTYTISPESSMRIEGTSNKSDWTVYAKQLSGTLTLADAETPVLQQVQVTIPANQVVSDKSVIMDKNMHNALEVEAFPEITYTLIEAVPANGDGDGFVLDTRGNLTLHGVTNEIAMQVQGTRADDGSLRFTGSHELDMTAYGIKPPVAMFGAWRVAKDVVVHFDLVATPDAAN